MESILSRERHKKFPNIPKSINELPDAIQKCDAATSIYKGTVYATDGSMAILLSTTALMYALLNAAVILFDGTFAVIFL